jgi:hypothetical protein
MTQATRELTLALDLFLKEQGFVLEGPFYNHADPNYDYFLAAHVAIIVRYSPNSSDTVVTVRCGHSTTRVIVSLLAPNSLPIIADTLEFYGVPNTAWQRTTLDNLRRRENE